jgi:hypothetical protein
VRCPQCGNDNPDEFAFCLDCGTHIGSAAPPAAAADPYWQGALDIDRNHQPLASLEPVPLPRVEPYQGATPVPGLPAIPRLIFQEGPVRVGDIELDRPATTIGRSHSNDVVLEDTRVSRHHARVTRNDAGVAIEDLGSRNGTAVNGRAVQGPQRLVDGDEVRVGDTHFRLSFEQVPDPLMPPTPHDAAEAHADSPVVFAVPWSPIRCPTCHAVGTMRPIVYGPAVATAAARQAADRGDIVIGGAAVEPDAPNAQCGSCRTRVRIIPATPER